MGQYKNEISRLREEMKKIYDPATALTDPRIADINRAIESVSLKMNGKEECLDCDGWGEIECDECGHERVCDSCDGEGLVESA
jgi:hypothetical protein